MRKKLIYLMMLALTMGFFTACNEDDNKEPEIVNPAPADQWSKTMRGDDQSIVGYPDIFANYWEYTYSYKDNPNIGLRLTGKFPKARFFNFTVYDDVTEIDVSSMEDVNIQQNEGSINPYVKDTENYTENGYTLYIIPASTPANIRASMKNVCEFPDSLEMVSVFMRLYLAQQYSNDTHGGTELPAIQAFDVTTGKEVAFPKHERCNIYEGAILPPMDFSDDSKPLRFMLAPLTLLYPNRPAQYLFTRIKLNQDEVATFRFIPPTAPKKVSDYPTADVRYWSICLGNSKGLSYKSIYDSEMPDTDKNGFVTFIIADEASNNLDALKAKAKANTGTYLLTWDRKDWGDGILALYRNMVINKNYEHSMSKMEPAPLGNLANFNPMTMIAMLALKDWGPQGYKFSETEFLSDNFNYALIRRMQ